MYQIKLVITFKNPAIIITLIGLIFVFLRSNSANINMPTITHFVSSNVACSFPQKAVIRIKTPEDAIIATTAGRREWSIPWSISSFRYFRYSFANIVTMMQEGRIHPRVATIAPGTPAIFKPTEVAELTASQMHLYLALLLYRDYFNRPDSSLSGFSVPQGLFPPTEFIPILHFFATGIISTGQIHPCLAFLCHRDYFNRLNASLSGSFVPQGLFRPTPWRVQHLTN